jgi:hypothetical protein
MTGEEEHPAATENNTTLAHEFLFSLQASTFCHMVLKVNIRLQASQNGFS